VQNQQKQLQLAAYSAELKNLKKNLPERVKSPKHFPNHQENDGETSPDAYPA